MLRHALAAAAALAFMTSSLVPDEAFARAGGGRGGGMRAGGAVHAGRVNGGRGYHVAGGIRPAHPIAGRPGYPGRPVAGYPWRGAAWGAAAATAAGAAAYGYYNNGAYNSGYYNNGCYYDANGRWVCANQYPYRY